MDAQHEFIELMQQRAAHGGEVLEGVQANVRVLQALLVLLMSNAPGMDLGEAVHYGHIGWMEVIETIRTADALPPPTPASTLTAPIPNTSKIGVWRIDPDNRYALVGLGDDPLAKAAAEQAKNN